jgi:hypothetical protein
MAEVWVAGLATVAVGAYTANQGKKGAQGAANSAAQTAAEQIAEERRQFDINQANQQPWLDFGRDQLEAQQRFLAGDTSGFQNSADYQFRLDQGLQSQERGASARGGFTGGGADADRIALAQGLAGQAADNYYAKLSSGSGGGYQAANNLGLAGANAAGNIAGYMQNAGNARQSSYAANADANSQFAAGVGGVFNNWYQQNRANNPGGTGWYVGNNPGRG